MEILIYKPDKSFDSRLARLGELFRDYTLVDKTVVGEYIIYVFKTE